MSPSMYLASLAWILLALGYLERRRRTLHVSLMVSGIGLDIALVLYLQLSRSAVQKALAFDLATLQQIHIACSTVALMLYFPVLYLGFTLVGLNRASVTTPDSAILNRQEQSRERVRSWHIRVAVTAFVARTLGLLFMFSMWKNP